VLYRRRQSKSVRKKRDGGFPYPRPVIYHTMPRTNLSLSSCPSQSTHEMRDSFDRASLTWPHEQDLEFRSGASSISSTLLHVPLQDMIILVDQVHSNPQCRQIPKPRWIFSYHCLGSSIKRKCTVKQIWHGHKSCRMSSCGESCGCGRFWTIMKMRCSSTRSLPGLQLVSNKNSKVLDIGLLNSQNFTEKASQHHKTLFNTQTMSWMLHVGSLSSCKYIERY
jgi:hypothetical protein